MLNQTELENSCELLRTVGDATRLRIISILIAAPKNVDQISKQLRLEQDKASMHLAELEAAGVVAAELNGQQVEYALRPAANSRGVDVRHERCIRIGACRLEFPMVDLRESIPIQ